MATVVNTPSSTDNGSGIGFLLVIILLIALIMLLMFYGIPYLGSMMQTQAPQVNVPGQIDVNINQPK